MNCGIYRTEAGSIVEITGKHCGVVSVDFDWFEEGGCCDCVPEPYPEEDLLVWNCVLCGGGSAKLFKEIL